MRTHHVPGTWNLTAKHTDGTTAHPIITFTSDGGLVERVDFQPETAIGVWEPGIRTNHFQFMWIRLVQNLPGGALAVRLRSTNRFTSADSFHGKAVVDFIDAAGNVAAGTSTFQTTHDGVRMRLVPK